MGMEVLLHEDAKQQQELLLYNNQNIQVILCTGKIGLNCISQYQHNKQNFIKFS